MNAVFTICAKNYLAQALTLKESAIKHNPSIHFYIFLSDLNDAQDLPNDLVLLNDEWIPNWQQMAFKYNVIEFSTSLKPFCFRKLFQERFENVIYFDPDVYVTSDLTQVFDYLNNNSIVLSPHYFNIQEKYSGAVPEEELLFVGIYNLGFCAIRNNHIGTKIVDWWTDRLSHSCYGDRWDGLHVDQKWMDFIPAFFPNDVLITHHAGINCAIWNLHERELLRGKDGIFLILDRISGELFKLLFFHFSGFDPVYDDVINRRHPRFNTNTYPTFIPIIKEYKEMEYRNGYDIYSKLSYSFNRFGNGYSILPLHRRIYRASIDAFETNNPFDTRSDYYRAVQKSHLLAKIKSGDGFLQVRKHLDVDVSKIDRCFQFGAILLKSIIGVKYYYFLLSYLSKFVRLENQKFMLRRALVKGVAKDKVE